MNHDEFKKLVQQTGTALKQQREVSPTSIRYEGARSYAVNEPSMNEFKAEGLVFNNEPAIPLKAKGSVEHEGWDIPSRWAIDANDQCWLDDAHGHALAKTNIKDLYLEVDNQSRIIICSVLGLGTPKPTWYEQAIKLGWTPPEVKYYEP